VVKHTSSVIDYRNEKLVCDRAFAKDLMLQLKNLAVVCVCVCVCVYVCTRVRVRE